MRNKIFATFSALALITSVSRVSADDLLLKDVSISGFVDTSYSANLTKGEATFSLDQFELDVEKKIKGVGALRADVNFGSLNEKLSTDDVLEQGYITLEKGPLSFMFGKFNAPIGFELLDAPDMYQFSHAMVFDSGLPANLTGASLSGAFGLVDFNAHVSNGWDHIVDDNKNVTVGGRLGVTPIEGVNIGFSYITGDEGAAPETLSVFDVDFTFTMVSNLTVGAELNIGKHENNSAVKAGDDAKWTGYLLMANYAFNDSVGLTLRYDGFNDSDGSRLGGGVEETRNSFTISPSLSLGEGFGGLIEYRYTSSDKDVFTDSDGKATGNESALALEFTYLF